MPPYGLAIQQASVTGNVACVQQIARRTEPRIAEHSDIGPIPRTLKGEIATHIAPSTKLPVRIAVSMWPLPHPARRSATAARPSSRRQNGNLPGAIVRQWSRTAAAQDDRVCLCCRNACRCFPPHYQLSEPATENSHDRNRLCISSAPMFRLRHRSDAPAG